MKVETGKEIIKCPYGYAELVAGAKTGQVKLMTKSEELGRDILMKQVDQIKDETKKALGWDEEKTLEENISTFLGITVEQFNEADNQDELEGQFLSAEGQLNMKGAAKLFDFTDVESWAGYARGIGVL